MKTAAVCFGGLAFLLLSTVAVSAAEPAKKVQERPSSLKYAEAKAYYVPPETNIEESGYFSLCEGKNGKIYIGTAAYRRNSYLVEFDPKTEKMRVVLDVHKLVGQPLEFTGYAAQSKIHTRNFVGPSGKIYVGTKQGYNLFKQYPSPEEKKTGKSSVYRGGYVIVYDPATDKSVSLGMPMPLGDKRLGPDATEGEGVIDVTADEERGLIYVVTCEHQHWMLYDTKHPENGYRDLGPILRDQPNTIVDNQGRGTAITEDYKIARYNPKTDKVSVDELLVEGQPFRVFIQDEKMVNGKMTKKTMVHPDWRLAADGKTAYMQLLNDLRLFQIDLSGEAGKPVQAVSLGERLPGGKDPDSRGSISIAPDGRVYSSLGVTNDTGFGGHKLHHVVRYDPKSKKMEDLGVYKVKNPDYFDFKQPSRKNADGSTRAHHNFHDLPDGTKTPLYVVLAMIVAHDGTIYATPINPFTLLRIDPVP